VDTINNKISSEYVDLFSDENLYFKLEKNNGTIFFLTNNLNEVKLLISR